MLLARFRNCSVTVPTNCPSLRPAPVPSGAVLHRSTTHCRKTFGRCFRADPSAASLHGKTRCFVRGPSLSRFPSDPPLEAATSGSAAPQRLLSPLPCRRSTLHLEVLEVRECGMEFFHNQNTHLSTISTIMGVLAALHILTEKNKTHTTL